MNLIEGDCLIELKKMKDKSVDFVYLDLPYGQTACSWDKKIDLKALWIELKRIARNDRTPFFFSCTTKFGFDLIEANKKWFRWDLVWKKNRAAGFLNAYKLPMRKHEMIYCFAKNSPVYDVSSHSEYVEDNERTGIQKDLYGEYPNVTRKRYKDPLPTSDITPPTDAHELVYCFAKKSPAYDVSSHKEYVVEGDRTGQTHNIDTYAKKGQKCISSKTHKLFKEPLPTSDITPPSDEHELVYCFAKKCPEYDVSSHSEYTEQNNPTPRKTEVYNKQESNIKIKAKTHKIPLPTSIIPPTDEHELVYCFAKKCPEYDVSSHKDGTEGGDKIGEINPETLDTYGRNKIKTFRTNTKHKEPLPTSEILLEDEQPSSWCEFNLDTKTGHRTAKPVNLMEFLLKYWSKEGQTVLDPTAGSGSMGIACKNMKRNFIGIEKDPKIFKLMEKRIGDIKE